MPYAESRPSKVKNVFWIYALRKRGRYPKSTTRSGKWLVFAKRENIDDVWKKVKEAVEQGRLGGSAKVATAKSSPLKGGSDAHVICVYTYDWTDRQDVRRVRSELRRLGIKDRIPYKTDEDTMAGKYRILGNTRISKYYE